MASATTPQPDDRATDTSRAWNSTASGELWGLDWRAVLPWTFDGVRVDAGTFDDALPFVEQHHPIFFPPTRGTPFLPEPMTAAKRRFSERMDVFLIRAEEQVIGVLMAHPTDWSTYYLRTASVLPGFRDRRVMGRVLSTLEASLRDAGIARVECEISVGNHPALRVMSRLGWHVTGTLTSERWGSLLRFTSFLRDEAETSFVQHYCGLHVPPPRSTDPTVQRPPTTERRTS